jgi:hypothetical protein
MSFVLRALDKRDADSNPENRQDISSYKGPIRVPGRRMATEKGTNRLRRI